MYRLTSALLTLPLLFACTSPVEQEPPCITEGPYGVNFQVESGSCASVYGYSPSYSYQSTVTVVQSGADPNVYNVESRVWGNACAMRANGCNLEGTCTLVTRSADQGSLKARLTFYKDGFDGLLTISLPTLTDGQGVKRSSCDELDVVTGVAY